jgi:hypothetical protein
MLGSGICSSMLEHGCYRRVSLKYDQGAMSYEIQLRKNRDGPSAYLNTCSRPKSVHPSVTSQLYTERVIFSENTCNGCHGGETATGFEQVVNRTSNSPSALSNFLLGVSNGTQCSLSTPNLSCVELVNDPVFPTHLNSFGDIARRVVVLQGLVTNAPRSGGLLLPFVRPHISFVH